jgi:hypothetical protein
MPRAFRARPNAPPPGRGPPRRAAALAGSPAAGRWLACALALPAVGAAAGGVAWRGLPQPARHRRPDRLPAQAAAAVSVADGVLLGEFGEERRTSRRSPDPQGDEGRGAGHRGRALLPARRRRLQGRGCAPRWPTCATLAARARRPSPCRWRATSTCPPRRPSPARSTRSCWPEDRKLLSKDQILELYMNQIFLGPARLRLCRGSEIYFGKPLRTSDGRRGGDAGRPAKAPSAYNPIATPSAPPCASSTSSTACSRTASSPRAARRGQGPGAALPHPTEVPVHAEYVAETARQLVHAQYGADAYTRGLNVYT